MVEQKCVAIIPAHPGEQAAVILSKELDLVILPVIAWRIMFQPDDDGPETYVAEPITALYSVDTIESDFALRLPDGRWHEPMYGETFDTIDEFLKWHQKPD